MGRPRVDSEELRARMERPLIDALDAWIAAQPDPKPTRPEAIRRLLQKALEGEQQADRELMASSDEFGS
jgi:hypothetical protein